MKKSRIALVVALLLCVISIIGAGLVQTDFGKVKVIDVTMETGVGTLTGYLFVPENATSENPAPAVVTSHGYLNNREMQDSTYVELARRGYVVFAMNAYGHGDSSVTSAKDADSISVTTKGMVDAVEYVYGLSFVDDSRIGITGHSMGAVITDATATYYSDLENEALKNGAYAEAAHALNKIAASLPVGYSYSTIRGYNCDIGLILGTYDEFFSRNIDGGNLTPMIKSDMAKDLVTAQTGLTVDNLKQGTFYKNSKNGYSIALYNPKQLHAVNHFSIKTTGYLVDFFEKTLKAPNPIAYSNQIWWLKELFNLLGFKRYI